MVLRIPTTSIRYRKQFHLANKCADETLENWYDRLKVLANSCDYGMYSEAFILNQFICGLDDLVLEYFLTEQKDLSVNDVFDLTKSFQHGNERVDDKDVWTSIKTEELDISDGEHYNDDDGEHYNDDDDDDDVQRTANTVIHEVNSVDCDARKDNIHAKVPLMTEGAIKPQEHLKMFECYICHKTFNTPGRLTYHITCCHSQTSKSTVKSRTMESPELPKSYECYLCDKPVKQTAGNLLYHFTLYHTIGKTSKCILCDKWVNDSSNMVRHLNTHFGEKEYRCNMCDAGFKKHTSLKTHLLSHNDPNVKEFRCYKCPKVFISTKQLKLHFKEHKRPELTLSEKLDNLISRRKKQAANGGKYKCDICAAKFDKESELAVHVKVHDANKLLCHLCGKKLMTKRNLKVHYLVHTNEKPYKCDECGRAFSTRSKCNRHARTHSDSGASARPHKCTLCDKSYTQKGHLTKHIKGHEAASKRFRCDQCPKNFFKQDQLTRHKLLHIGITRPWQCNFCEKSFKTNYIREEHERTHTGEKPYRCPICSKSFAQQNSLRGHGKVHLKPPKPKTERTKKKRMQKTDDSTEGI